MAYRTLQAFGTVDGNTAATITVGDQVVHSGPLVNGLLFKFITDVMLQGNITICINVQYGSLTITNYKVMYPALLNGVVGHVIMPQPFTQQGLPLIVDSVATYDHYMINGPTQWIINASSTNRVIEIDNFYNSIKSGFIDPDWQYDYLPVDIEKLK